MPTTRGYDRWGMGVTTKASKPGSRTDPPRQKTPIRARTLAPLWRHHGPRVLNRFNYPAIGTSRWTGACRFRWASTSSGTRRYRVARLTPRTWATSVTGVFSPIIFRACFNFGGLNTVGRPPRRPRSRAAANPARVRS